MEPPVPELAERATACAERLLAADEVLVASHIDADGLTSAAIASTALQRAGLAHEVHFEKQLDEAAVARIAATDYDTVLFTDFGSGQLPHVVAQRESGAFDAVIADHHQPVAPDGGVDADAADAGGSSAGPGGDFAYHLNPLLFGVDGAAELSGAGTTYVLARALAEADGSGDNRDLAALAVVGAVGDMQASGGTLFGANAAVVAEGVAAGVLEAGTDLSLFGQQPRPLPTRLEYAGDVPSPGITGVPSGAIRFLDDLGLDLKGEDGWRRWVDLSDDEKQAVASALIQRAVSRGVPADRVNSLVGTAYVLTREQQGTELRDASEFSTLLNATARYERADVGLAVCLGGRGGAYDRARTLLSEHRRNLSEGIELVEQEGVEHAEHVQWFHAEDRIRETIVGIVAGMAVGADGIDRDKPIVAFADKDDGNGKVSARATPRLVRRGVDLSAVMGEAAAAVDGEGGGHDVAAGATVPEGREQAFVDAADEVVGDQLG
jgi:RecJ-like exonuclease